MGLENEKNSTYDQGTKKLTVTVGKLEFEVSRTVTQNKLFEVNPMEIDRSMFEDDGKRSIFGSFEYKVKACKNKINNAFSEVDKNPEKYASSFYTLIPDIYENLNNSKNMDELKAQANELGGNMADWVEQYLEWAQRISNGETWEDLCKKADTAGFRRMIIEKNGEPLLVGHSIWEKEGRLRKIYPVTEIDSLGFCSNGLCEMTVPLVVIRKSE